MFSEGHCSKDRLSSTVAWQAKSGTAWHLRGMLTYMERAVPILPAGGLAVAKAFYVDGLGFRVTFEASQAGRSGLLGIERGTIQLTLDSPMEGHGRNACVSIHVDDTDAFYREWSAKVPVLRSPRDEAWGARTFDLLDPSGNTLFVMGPLGGKKPD
jgi:catechol 2,3-dioxygenase-like lactoylglutathione lyase family enzyme